MENENKEKNLIDIINELHEINNEIGINNEIKEFLNVKNDKLESKTKMGLIHSFLEISDFLFFQKLSPKEKTQDKYKRLSKNIINLQILDDLDNDSFGYIIKNILENIKNDNKEVKNGNEKVIFVYNQFIFFNLYVLFKKLKSEDFLKIENFRKIILSNLSLKIDKNNLKSVISSIESFKKQKISNCSFLKHINDKIINEYILIFEPFNLNENFDKNLNSEIFLISKFTEFIFLDLKNNTFDLAKYFFIVRLLNLLDLFFENLKNDINLIAFFQNIKKIIIPNNKSTMFLNLSEEEIIISLFNIFEKILKDSPREILDILEKNIMTFMKKICVYLYTMEFDNQKIVNKNQITVNLKLEFIKKIEILYFSTKKSINIYPEINLANKPINSKNFIFFVVENKNNLGVLEKSFRFYNDYFLKKVIFKNIWKEESEYNLKKLILILNFLVSTYLEVSEYYFETLYIPIIKKIGEIVNLSSLKEFQFDYNVIYIQEETDAREIEKVAYNSAEIYEKVKKFMNFVIKLKKKIDHIKESSLKKKKVVKKAENEILPILIQAMKRLEIIFGISCNNKIKGRGIDINKC